MNQRVSLLLRQLAGIIAGLFVVVSIQDDLGADSLDILQLLMRIEDDYGVVIPDEELATFETVEDVVKYLESQKS